MVRREGGAERERGRSKARRELGPMAKGDAPDSGQWPGFTVREYTQRRQAAYAKAPSRKGAKREKITTSCLPFAPSRRRVALGGYPPRAPTDPYVGTLGHTVPRVTPSLRQRHDTATNPSSAIRRRFGNTLREFNASKRVSRRRCGYSVPRFPSPGSSWVEFPGFRGTPTKGFQLTSCLFSPSSRLLDTICGFASAASLWLLFKPVADGFGRTYHRNQCL